MRYVFDRKTGRIVDTMKPAAKAPEVEPEKPAEDKPKTAKKGRKPKNEVADK